MRVLVTGLTGFVGSYLGHALVRDGHDVVALVRPGHERKLGKLAQFVTPAFGDLAQPHTLGAAVEGVEAVINLVGIIREDPWRGITFEKVHWQGTRDLVDAGKAAGVHRFLQMSAAGVGPAGTGYQRTKFHAEEYVRGAGLDWTIFRPSVIFGDPRGRPNFVTELAAPMRVLPAFPLFGEGDELLQPVYVGDVAEAFARALVRPQTIHQTYCLGGPEALPFRLIARTVAAALDRPDLPMIPVPLPLVQLGVQLGERLPGFPINSDQLAMMRAGNVCDENRWQTDLEITPRAFTAAALDYLRQPQPEPEVAGAPHFPEGASR